MSPTPEIASVVKEAAKKVADAGDVVTEARPERIKEAYEMYGGILWADGGAWARRR